MLDDRMDIDAPPDLSDNQLEALQSRMNGLATLLDWPVGLSTAEADERRWPRIMHSVLGNLLTLLDHTDMEERIQGLGNAESIVNKLSAGDRSRWRDWIRTGIKSGDWTSLIANWRARSAREAERDTRDRHQVVSAEELAEAYRSPFVGAAPDNFVQHLTQTDKRVKGTLYCNAISVVQSSGTGKSRMLTEVGAKVFTLPVCLRNPNDPGYPLSDEAAFLYFHNLRSKCGGNDLSLSTLSGIACFLAAAYETMLSRLRDIQQEVGKDVEKIREKWYRMMEKDSSRGDRVVFFQDVVERAEKIEKIVQGGSPQRNSANRAGKPRTGNSPKPDGDNKAEKISPGNSPKPDGDNKGPGKATDVAKDQYDQHVKKAFKDLMTFIETLTDDICVTYFDEAHELDICFWIMLRLLNAHDRSQKMWYVFLGTKSSMSYYSPSPKNMISARLRNQSFRLELPYFVLDFDQRAIENTKAPGPVKMSDFGTIKHLAQYGRPLWHAQSHENITAATELAASKLTEFQDFEATDPHHVFAVLSQRLCLDPVLSNARAVELADNSVAHHMRLLTGFLFGGAISRTDSPSEPLLALGAASLMYEPDKEPNRLAAILGTLNLKLFSAGLIEKGLMGELAARFLLLVARDYAAPIGKTGPDLLKPVRLLEVLEKLLGKLPWDRSGVKAAFDDTYVNFTHWILTRDALPEKPTRKLLSNLWARGAILQCCFNQVSIDFLCPIYFGSVEPDTIFDPDQLSGLVVQVKFKDEGDVNAQRKMRPAGIVRDPNDPLPYLALLMELGTTVHHKASSDVINGRIKITPPNSVTHADYERLTKEHEEAFQKLSQHQMQYPRDKTVLKKLKAEVEGRQLEKEHYNRYLITVRGADLETYPILGEARIASDFGNLLEAVKPQLLPLNIAAGHMRPLEHLRDGCPATDWLFNYAQ